MAPTPPHELLTPDSPLASATTIGAKTRTMLHQAGMKVVRDLLEHYPRRYEDRRHFGSFPLDETAEAVCLHGLVTDCSAKRAGYRRHVEVTVNDAQGHPLAGPIHCRWFNMPWMIKAFAVGQEIVLFGRVKEKKRQLFLDHPDYEIIEPHENRISLHMGRLVPVYPLGDGLVQKPLREAMHAVLEQLDDESVPPVLPEVAVSTTTETISHRAAAWRAIHFPATRDEAAAARRWLALEEFFALQLNVLMRRRAAGDRPGVIHAGSGALVNRWRDGLPFSLTTAQNRSIAEVHGDLAASRPMNRLLQGDVGSGKTFVALAAALLATESGHQTAIMAPTQILAEQHYLHFQKHLTPLGVRVGLRTATRKEQSTTPLLTSSDHPHIMIGTHALLFDESVFDNLGLVVIDEQHKFGVAQRARLVSHGRTPDVLVMTATPIPRTLALTLYGDLDVSVLDELPAGRGKITTAVRQGVDLNQVTAFVRQQLDKGRQAYVVYPLVDESETLAVKSATAEHKAWQGRLPGVEVGLLHGRLKPEAKEAVMTAFRSGQIRVLISTTVIEVGVDVPNATLMLVFNAERFGLAQLHQLRGRVGRGAHHSYCVLVCSDGATDGMTRLQVLERTRDGFEIAEADLRLRGPGELLGEKQSGLQGLRLGDLVADAPLIIEARALAEAVLQDDPDLTMARHQPLRALLHQPEAAAVASAN